MRSCRNAVRSAALALVAWFAPSLASAQVVCHENISWAERQLLIQSRYVGYHSSHDLAVPNSDVRRAVILVHGLHGNAVESYRILYRSTCNAEDLGYYPDAARETILIAPHFLTTADTVPSNYHYWKYGAWSAGNLSETSPAVSSYAVVDALISKLVSSFSRDLLVRRRFPNLETIVVAGHSAGGQFAHRYAATNGRDGAMAGVQMRYVVANPSSYLYLDDRRPYTDYPSGVGDPYTYVSTPWVSAWVRNAGFSDAPMCPTSYNDWKYGLDDPNTYAGAVGAATIRERLVNRRVTVLLGTADTGNTNDLDTSCPAMLQGDNRYERGRRFLEYMGERFPTHHHGLVEVEGIAHDEEAMFVDGGGNVGTIVLFIDNLSLFP